MAVVEASGTSRRRRLVAAGVLALAMAVVGGLALTLGDDDDRAPVASDPFGPNWTGVAERVKAAGLPAQGTEAPGAPHSHQTLNVFVRGEYIPVPVNIGIPPGGDGMPPLHTHTADGTLHVEGVARASLGQFMQVWGVPFSAQRLGPYRSSGAEIVRVWVKEPGDDIFVESREFEDLRLRDGQEIYVAYGTREDSPIHE